MWETIEENEITKKKEYYERLTCAYNTAKSLSSKLQQEFWSERHKISNISWCAI